MGACCGKGSQPKDPDKSPYAPSSTPQKDNKGKGKDKGSKDQPKVPVLSVDKSENGPRNNKAGFVIPSPNKVPDHDNKPDGKDKAEEKNHKSMSSSPSSSLGDEDGEKGKQDSAQSEKQPEKVQEVKEQEQKLEKEDKSPPVDQNQSLNSTTSEEIDTPQVELHIDESKLDLKPDIKPSIESAISSTPLSSSPKEKSPPGSLSPKRTDASFELSSSIPRKIDSPTIKHGDFQEEIPDPCSIIEKVRNKSKEGGYSDLSESSQSEISSKVTHTTITTTKIQQNGEPVSLTLSPKIEKSPGITKPKDVNQNDSMAILGALKIIRESGGEASLQKEEIKTIIEEIKSDNQSGECYVTEVKVERSTKVITSEGSKIPISPIRKEAVLVESELKEKVEKESETSNGRARKSSVPLHSPPIIEITKKDEYIVEAPKSPPPIVEQVIKENGSFKNGQASFKVSFADKVVTPASSESSLSDTSPIEDGPVLLQNKKASIQEILPDFRAANAEIMSKLEFCSNTRISTLRTIDQWIDGELPGNGEHPRTMVLKSSLGMGKSSLLKHICSKYALQLAAHHFFCYNSSNLSHNDFNDVIMYIIFLFLEKFEHYMACLPSLDKVEETLLYGTTDEILETFVYNPLTSENLDHDDDRKMIIVMDALDECSVQDRDAMFQFVDIFNAKLPSWMYLLVSIRDENQLMSKLSDVFVVDMKNNNENMTDMKRIMKDSLGNFMDRISLDGGLTQLAKKTNGLVLCASLYNKTLQNMDHSKKIALREIEAKFPTGLSGILEKVFGSFQDTLESESDSKQKYSILLGILCFAREPIHGSVFEAVGLKNSENIKDALTIVLAQSDDLYYIHHKAIAEWLLNEKLSRDLHLDTGIAKTAFARFCMDWIDPVINQSQTVSPLSQYALKNSISHVTDITKQQDNIGKVMCNLKVIHNLLNLDDVTINDVLKQYSHSHSQLGETQKYITLDDYLKKFPKIAEQISMFRNFLTENKEELMFSPECLYQIAANYPKNERIQQNARVEMGNQPWLEDLSVVPESKGICTMLPGSVCTSDVLQDGKNIAVVVKDDKYNIYLMQYNASNGAERSPPVDIKSLEGRTGLCCKFLPDNTSIFVGSLTHFVNNKGKIVPSGIDTSTIQIKQKYSIESCYVSSKYLALSLTTFPWGGRSVHLALLNIKDKKCVKTLEVLQYRFGGSANFGMRCVAISPDDKMVAACIKDSNKNQLKVNIWGIGKWDVLFTTTVAADTITKCHFVDGNVLMMDVKEKDGNPNCVSWSYKSPSNEITNLGMQDNFNSCTLSSNNTVCASWKRKNGNAQITVWNKGETLSEETGTKYRLYGIKQTNNVLLSPSHIIFAEDDVLKIFECSELPSVEGMSPQLSDLCLSDVSFMPRSDTSILANIEGTRDNNQLSIFNCDTITEEAILKELNLPSQTIAKKENKFAKVFQGTVNSSQTCQVSSDGNYLVLNLGTSVSVWNKLDDTLQPLPTLNNGEADEQFTFHCLASSKEPVASVVYEQAPNVAYIYDLKTKQEVRKLSLDGDVQKPSITDMTFMPHGGFLVTYHKNDENKIVVWNTRLGKQVNSVSRKLYFCRPSVSSDRLLLSYSESNFGNLELRNSDGKFSAKLNVPDEWSFRKGELDADFSPDGTIAIGVETILAACRIWNAGNGEVLKDLDVKFKGVPSIVGMLTNTHVTLYDERIQIIDIASGDVMCVAPIAQEEDNREDMKQLIISPRGNIIAGCYSSGRVLMWKCHNFSAVKRKTTLQRIKSFSSP